MRNNVSSIFLVIGILFTMLIPVSAVGPLSEESKNCIDCHTRFTPGIIEDWNKSRHSSVTPTDSFEKPKLERRISVEYITEIPPEFREVVVGCYECHGQNPQNHSDHFSHNGYTISPIISPNDCSTCHPVEKEEYVKGVMANAHGNLKENSIYRLLYETITTVSSVNGTEIEPDYISTHAQNGTCFGCHGTKLVVEGIKEVKTEDGLSVKVPNIIGWPNQGVGRINPDGSIGACTSCHPRHNYAIEVARKPYICGKCHYKPDVPAYNVYMESNHGNIFASHQSDYNFSAVPWTVGVDFRAPTCSVCHNALVVDKAGNVVAQRTHYFDGRIWLRLFGVYAYPQPLDGKVYNIVNKDGQNLPTTLTGEPPHNT